MANSDTTIKTGGGASVGRDVQAGGDFVGRDQINFIVPLGNWEEVRRLLFKGQARVGAAQALQEQFQTFDWAKAEQAYLDKVIKLYDRVRILGSSADVPLGDIFTQVYILDKPTASYRHDIDELRKHGYDRFDFQRQPGQRMHGLDLVKTNQNLFILGKPGAGKTTFLKYITIQAARKQLPRIPIFVSLNQWADSQWGKGANAALLPFLIEQFEICDFPDAALFIDYLLKEGRALVLFDGLDEVKQEQDQRRRLTHLLQDFARKYDKSQHLITCRIAASDYAFAGFADVEVADFTPDQVREYARNWFGEQEKKFDAFTTDLTKAENQGLAELCNTPLLLALLCLTFDNNMRFPPSRAELYEDALETLLRKWDASKQIQRDEIYRELSHKRKLQLLVSIAVPTFEKGELFFRQRDLEKRIVDYLAKLPGAPPADTLDGIVILKAIEVQHSILVERAQGIYSFSHLTFQEYLTARYVTENQGRGVSNKLIHNHLTDKRWREVFLLTASLLDNADEFITATRQATDEIIADTPTVTHLLTWVYNRSQHSNISIDQRRVVQLVYIFLALVRDLALNLEIALDAEIAKGIDDVLDRVRSLACIFSPDQSNTLSNAFDTARSAARLCTASKAVHRAVRLSIDLERDRGIDRSKDRVVAQTLNRAVDLTRILDHEGTLEQGLDLAQVLEQDRDLAQVLNPLVGFDYGLYCAWAYASVLDREMLDRTEQNGKKVIWQKAKKQFPSLVQGVASIAIEAGLAYLRQKLTGITSPHTAALFTIMCDERDLGHEWGGKAKDISTLNNYLYANELLVQCLKVAAVSDRQAVLNGLLLPPGVGKPAK